MVKKLYRIYEDGLYSKGYIVLTYLVQYYCDLEEYENANIVLKVLRDNSKKLNFELSTVYNDDSIRLFQEMVLEVDGKSKSLDSMKIVIEENAKEILKNVQISSI